MNWAGKKVLVTGAAGFIGSHLTERLTSEGAQVRAMAHYNSRGACGWLDSSSMKDDFEVFLGDVCDSGAVLEAMRDREVVFHLAALIAIPYSYHAPRSYVQTNVMGTLNVLEAARAGGLERVVHTSTSEVYGSARRVPIDESHPLQGQSPYSATKIGADKLVESYHCSFETPVVTVRPFNTFGPRQSARAVIPTVISQCLAGIPLRLGNLSPTRDLNFVANTVDGFLLAGATEAAEGRTVNLGTGREISIGDLARLIAKMTGAATDVAADHQRVRPEGSEVNRLLADNTLAKQLLGWEPRVNLEQGLQQTIDWMRENLEHYRPEEYSI